MKQKTHKKCDKIQR